MSAIAEVLAADLTWTGGRFETGIRVAIGEDGRIAAVTRETEDGDPPSSAPLRRLRHRALLPGFVNAHSHAFQRGLRGRGEVFPQGVGDFWSWREEMYGLVGRLDRDSLYRLTLAAFREMRAAGITTVGEFHYLHHDDPAERDFAFDEVVLAAAAEAPIRIVLLEAFYAHGGIGEAGAPQPLAGAQLRFATPSLEDYWRQMDRLAETVAGQPAQSLGAVAHSIRAATPSQVATLHAEARRRGLPFHMHVEEQVQEIDACVAAYGRRPMQILLDDLDLDRSLTAVHCTHTALDDLQRFVAAGGNPCICPLTEANLGDGIPPLAELWAADRDDAGHCDAARLCLGSDSNARISMLEEARWLEYGQRLAARRRGVLREGAGQALGDGEAPGEAAEVAGGLLAAATAGGARSLGVDAGRIEAGTWADLVTVDLDHPRLAGAVLEAGGDTGPPNSASQADTLAAALVFGADDAVLAESCLAGVWTDLRSTRPV